MPDTRLPDFYDFDSCLSEDERQVRDTVARWVDDRVLPIIGECFEKERFPMELVPEMAEMGLFGPTFQDYGCAGLNNVCYGLIMQELERGDSGVRSFASVQSGLCMYPIHAYGSPEQKQRWLPDMAKGRKIGCFGLTEPDGGSDPGAMKTRAVRKGGDWILNGAKMWITNGSIADLAIVWAATDDPNPDHQGAASDPNPDRQGAGSDPNPDRQGAASDPNPDRQGAGSIPNPDRQGAGSIPNPDRKGAASDPNPDRKGAVPGGPEVRDPHRGSIIRGFIVEKGMPGYTTRDIPHKFSLRASTTSELFFDNVKVPDANRLPKAEGLGAPLGCLTQARYGIAWGGIGAAMACYREALEFARQRVLFGTTLDRKQIVQMRLAEMARQITASQFLCLQLGRLKDAGKMHHSQVSLAKWHCVRMGLDIARDARDLLGAGGISIECGPIRHMLNLESVITYEGTESIHQLIVGREITGHGAF